MHSFSSSRLVLVGSIVLLLLFAVSLRVFPRSSVRPVVRPSVPSSTSSTDPSVSSVPAFASATFASGDALKGLGPEWTYLRQSVFASQETPWIAGTSPTRESVVKLIGKDVELLLEEADIKDAKALGDALQGKEVHTAKVGERDGYVVPMGDIAGGTGFLLKGQTSILIIQDTNSLVWPSEPSSELLTYIHSVNVP